MASLYERSANGGFSPQYIGAFCPLYGIAAWSRSVCAKEFLPNIALLRQTGRSCFASTEKKKSPAPGSLEDDLRDWCRVWVEMNGIVYPKVKVERGKSKRDERVGGTKR